MNVQTPLMLWRFSVSYMIALIITAFVTTLDLMMLQTIIPYRLFSLLICDIVIMLLMLAAIRWRLTALIQVKVQTSQVEIETSLAKEKRYYRLFRLPYELFAIVMLLSTIKVIGLYVMQHPAAASDNWNERIVFLAFELSRACLSAILLWLVSKMMLRSYVLQLQLLSINPMQRTSTSRSIVFVYAVCLMIACLASARLTALAMIDHQINLVLYMLVVGMYTLCSIVIILIHTASWKRDLKEVMVQLQRLNEKSEPISGQPLTVFAYDEIGSLAMAFNKVQVQLVQQLNDLAKQLAMARDIQQRLLPSVLPNTGSIRIAAYCEACYEVGGDFYDVIRISETKLLVAIGDVSGKGMSAAMLMSVMLAALRAEAAKGDTSPGELLTRLNERLYAITKGRLYVTIGLVVLDIEQSGYAVESNSPSEEEAEDEASIPSAPAAQIHCSYSSAGHLAPYIVSNGQLLEIEQAALPLGIAGDESYMSREQQFTLAKGETMVMYTDGVIEELVEDNQMFGFERWENELRQLDRQTELVHTLDLLLERLPYAQDQHRRQDDRTIVLIRHSD